jgi:hypothetical protein
MKRFRQPVETKILVSAIIRGEESTITKLYSVTAITLRYILSLSHDALCCGETLLLPKVTALAINEAVISTDSFHSGNIFASKNYCSDS